ncbi:hypothetical protein [Moritella sp. Urea-trap-13]|uniref:hypothetical protein n=1 Tax=Moritella sp. Urea-trap-13 TaxID=2058327 RepID=UPI000C331CE5|nr:hypothetical protein [Moritella sp. Urea-trap-13]PKH06629.1 hypothetical protein CXF93_12050 [Moritella sp. Urea-trap-13]
MKQVLKYILLLIITFSLSAHADENEAYIDIEEVECEINNESGILVENHIYSDGDTMVSFYFPLIEHAKLKRVELRYGNLSSSNQYDIYTQLSFEESFREDSTGYDTDIILAKNHKPLHITAIYHFEKCHSKFVIDIKNKQQTDTLKSPDMVTLQIPNMSHFSE